jgi:hypothetical protein
MASDGGLIGRDGELARLRGLVDPPPRESRVLVLLGDAGMGKSVPFAERAAAHLRIADTLRDQPDRYAWHLAAAALEPDERVASLLEETAAQAQRRGGAAAAARALEHAAELSPGEGDRARRLQAAGTLALAAGQADWVRELAAGVLAVTADPDLRIAARALIAWALIWSNRHAEALATLIEVATEASARQPVAAWDAIGLAGTAAYHCGTPAAYQAVLSTLDRMHEPEPLPADWPPGFADAQRVGWAARRGPVFMLDESGPFPDSLPPNPACPISRHRAFQRFMPRARPGWRGSSHGTACRR